MASHPARPKFVMLGKSYVGKSSLVMRLLTDAFREYLQPTQADFYTCKRTIGERIIHFDLWDTAGQERFKSLLPMYTRDAMVAVVVFDVNDPLSLESAVTQLKENKHLPILALVANKIDMLQDPENDALILEAKKQADDLNANFFLASAKTGVGVAKMFDVLALTAAKLAAKPGDPTFDEPKASGSKTVDRYDRVDLAAGANADASAKSYRCWSFWGWWGSSSSSAPSDNKQ